jgi:hypothetical protein
LFIIKIVAMAKYSKKASVKVERAMHEMKEGTLKSSSGRKVTNPKQAVAIGAVRGKRIWRESSQKSRGEKINIIVKIPPEATSCCQNFFNP